jgi:peptidoglycan-associated lipoprotein
MRIALTADGLHSRAIQFGDGRLCRLRIHLERTIETALKSILQDFPGLVLTVEGHCDERGSAEYNLALGDLRARTARDFLAELGVAERQLEVISYGKERPQCEEPEPSCWQKNRRAHTAKK